MATFIKIPIIDKQGKVEKEWVNFDCVQLLMSPYVDDSGNTQTISKCDMITVTGSLLGQSGMESTLTPDEIIALIKKEGK